MDDEQLHFDFVEAAIRSERIYALDAVLNVGDYERDKARSDRRTGSPASDLPFNGGDSAYVAVYSDYPKSNPLRYCMRGKHFRVNSPEVQLPLPISRILGTKKPEGNV